MKVSDLLNHFKSERKPVEAAANAAGVTSNTIRVWKIKKKGIIPEHRACFIHHNIGIPIGEEDYRK